MAQAKFTLYKYVKLSAGKWRYCSAAVYKNNTVKSVIVGTREEAHQEGDYHIAHAGKWINVGPDVLDAQWQQHRLLAGGTSVFVPESETGKHKLVTILSAQPQEPSSAGAKRSRRKSLGILASLLAVATLLSYLFIYTPLKRKTPLCTLAGALPGAVPPLIGWAAARGRLEPEAWVLYATVFLWQFPHFMPIACMYREDYARAGYLVLPAGEIRDRFVVCQSFAVSLVLVPLGLLPAIVPRIRSLLFDRSTGPFWLYRSFHFLSTLQLLSCRVCLMDVPQIRHSVHELAKPSRDL